MGGVGEDGPTHQPIEHLASYRAMPGMLMMRPADGNETMGAYKIAVEGAANKRPTTLALSRQVVPNLAGTTKEGVAKGAYVVQGEAAGKPVDCVLMGTGTELELACRAGNCSKNKVMRTESRSSRPTASAESPSKLPPPLAGLNTRSNPSAEMASAPPPRPRLSTKSSASPPMRWLPRRSP